MPILGHSRHLCQSLENLSKSNIDDERYNLSCPAENDVTRATVVFVMASGPVNAMERITAGANQA